LCKETSGLNSRVIHSGFHEAPGSLKSELAREGSALVIRYAEERGIKLLKTGMLIAAPSGSIGDGLWKEADKLWILWRRGRRHNIPFKFVFTSAGIRHLAPIQAMFGIFIPSVCVIDVERLVESLANDAAASGAHFFYGSEVIEISIEQSSHVIRTSNGNISARVLINSAGLGARRISVMAGGKDVEIELIRGDYYELVGGVARWNIRTLIYPTLPERSRSKGIHFGPRTDGRLFLGPSATALSEEPAAKQVFLSAARKFVPAIREDDLRWAYSGLRPKWTDANGNSDFLIRLERVTPPFVNLLGIDSPGLSASMAIARHVASIVQLQKLVT
jgi:glycerol-3-phosphate dehydrogenase